jgi:quercetin dioxygenase-like cupin family protein
MKITHYSEAESKKFQSEAVKGVTGRVVVGKADGAKHFCMRVFEIDKDGFSPRHSHDWEHEIFIHAGKGEAFNQGKWIPVEPGYVLFIPSDTEHQIRNTGDSPLIFICLIPSGAPEL